MIRVAAWNVNSIRSRIAHPTTWLRAGKPDVVLLQELKVPSDGFPRIEVEDLGYNLAIVGQKTYNGVAILSRHKMSIEAVRLPGDEGDEHARIPVDASTLYARNLLAFEEPLVLGGDYNVAPSDEDVYDPLGWKDDALCRPETRAKYRRLLNLGLVDAYRALNLEPRRYTFWDYQAGCWQNDQGLRIDHLLLSPQAADRLAGSNIDKEPRGLDKPSDHTPIWCDLDL